MQPRSGLALARALKSRTERNRSGLYTVERVGAFVRAIDQGLRPVAVVHAPPLLRSVVAQMQLRRLAADGVPVERVKPELFREVHTAARASGVLAVLEQRWVPLGDADPDAGLCWLALERVRSPGNLGTILRTAEAVGAAGLICLSGQVDPYDPEVVRASMGGAALLPMVRASPEALSAWARRHDAQLVAADAGAEERFDTFVWPRRTVLVLGEERRGVSGRVARTCTRQVAIPIVGTGNSLNVAVAAGVLLYAAWSARRN